MSLPTFTKVGRICKDIEFQIMQNGKELAKTSIVFSEKYKDNENTCFIDIVAFGGTAKTLNSYFQKGHRIEGVFKLQQEKWTTQDGQQRNKHTLVLERIGEFIEQKNQATMEYQQQQPQQGYNHSGDGMNRPANHEVNEQQQTQQQPQQQTTMDDDEIPF